MRFVFLFTKKNLKSLCFSNILERIIFRLDSIVVITRFYAKNIFHSFRFDKYLKKLFTRTHITPMAAASIKCRACLNELNSDLMMSIFDSIEINQVSLQLQLSVMLMECVDIQVLSFFENNSYHLGHFI